MCCASASPLWLIAILFMGDHVIIACYFVVDMWNCIIIRPTCKALCSKNNQPINKICAKEPAWKDNLLVITQGVNDSAHLLPWLGVGRFAVVSHPMVCVVNMALGGWLADGVMCKHFIFSSPSRLSDLGRITVPSGAGKFNDTMTHFLQLCLPISIVPAECSSNSLSLGAVSVGPPKVTWRRSFLISSQINDFIWPPWKITDM